MRILLLTVPALAALVPLTLEQASAQYLIVSEHHQTTRQFHIGAGEAQVTLNEFSRQSGLQLLYDFNTVLGIRTREINGDMEPVAALKSMIDGTRLGFEFVNEATVAVVAAKNPVSSGKQQRETRRIDGLDLIRRDGT